MALVTFPDLSWLGSSLRAAMNAHTATYDERARERWVAEPAKRGAGVKVADVAALVEKLKNEAKVI